jgi:hypothetical protein
MNKIRLFYLFSLLILILLFVLPSYFIFKPTTPEESISRSSEHEFVELGKTLSFKLQHYNPESEDKNYSVTILLNDKEIINFTRAVENHSYLKYLGRFEDSERIRGNITVLIYKEGELEPIDKLTYSLGAKQ